MVATLNGIVTPVRYLVRLSKPIANGVWRRAVVFLSATLSHVFSALVPAFAIGGVVLVSAVLMTIEYVFTIVEGPDDGGGMCEGLRF